MKTQSFLQYLLLSFGLLASLHASDSSFEDIGQQAEEFYSEPYPLYDRKTSERCYCQSHFSEVEKLRKNLKESGKKIPTNKESIEVLQKIKSCWDCLVYKKLIDEKKRNNILVKALFIVVTIFLLSIVGMFAYLDIYYDYDPIRDPIDKLIMGLKDEEVADDTYDREDL